MAITRRTKLYVKKSLSKNGNLTGKFYAQTGEALWDVTKDVFELYCAKTKSKAVNMQCHLHRGAITDVAIAIQECKIKAISLANIA
jgi:hypothetical protein